MRTFATLAVLAAAVSAECFDTEDGGSYCDGEWTRLILSANNQISVDLDLEELERIKNEDGFTTVLVQ